MAEKKKPETAAAKPPRKRAPRKTTAKAGKTSSGEARPEIIGVPRGDVDRLVNVEHASPHSFLGAHPATIDGEEGAVVRASTPSAVRAECVLPDGRVVQLEKIATGLTDLYQCFIPGMTPPFSYRLRFYYADGAVWEREDPYRFLPTVGEMDLHLFNEGNHRELWTKLGAHVRTE